MRRVTARFYAPPGVATDRIKSASFVGTARVQDSLRTGSANPAAFCFTPATSNRVTASRLSRVCPPGSVVPPTALQNVLWFLADWWPLIFFPLLTLAFVMTRYLASGRDVDRGLAVSVEWNPPKNLTPAEVGTLMDERCDMDDIVSTLVDLAARGYLIIEEIESTKFLFFSSKDYRFIRRHPDHDITAEPLLPHERKFLEGVFGSATMHPSADSATVTLSSLKNKFYTHLPEIRSAIYESLTKKHMFVSNPDTTRKTYTTVGMILLIGGFIGAIFRYGCRPDRLWSGCRSLRDYRAVVVTRHACQNGHRLARAARMSRFSTLSCRWPRKTASGYSHRTTRRFSDGFLPYAMVLGVADQWADAFRDLLTQPPDWYVGPGYGYGHPFSSHAFVNDLGSGMNSMGNTFSSAPSSSGGSGGRGFLRLAVAAVGSVVVAAVRGKNANKGHHRFVVPFEYSSSGVVTATA
jgi:hypothetical protein